MAGMACPGAARQGEAYASPAVGIGNAVRVDRRTVFLFHTSALRHRKASWGHGLVEARIYSFEL